MLLPICLGLWLLSLPEGADPATMPPLTFDELQAKMRAFQESRILLTAVELDLFTAIGEGATAEEAARKAGTHPRGTEVLLNALAAMGALEKRAGKYFNTPATRRYLVAGSPDYARPALMHTVHLFDSWATLTACVRAGTAVGPPAGAAQNAERTENFIAAMHWRARADAEQLARTLDASRVRRMLDPGGGSGVYSIAFAKANPELRAEILDLEPVTRIARRFIAEAGLDDRVTVRAGDMLRDQLGEGYDLILLSAICHMFDPAQNRELLRRCFRALAPGGRLAIRDFILNPDRISPPHAAMFAVNMLVNTKGGSTYTEEEYAGWLREAGFAAVTRAAPDLLVATKGTQ